MDAEAQYTQTLDTWDAIADLYAQKFMDMPIYHATYDQFLQHIPSPEPVILDAGCGPGAITKYILSKRPDAQITATDFAPAMIALAAQVNPQANCMVADLRTHPNTEATYNGIICGFALPYLHHTDGYAWIAQAYRALIQGGIFYVSFVEGDSARSGPKQNSRGGTVWFHYYSEKEMEGYLHTLGFDLLHTAHVPYPGVGETQDHVIMIAQKNSATSTTT